VLEAKERIRSSLRKQYLQQASSGLGGLSIDEDESDQENHKQVKGMRQNIIKRNTRGSVPGAKPFTNTGKNKMMMMAHMDEAEFLELIYESNEVFESKDDREQASNALLGLRVNKDDWVADDHAKECTECGESFTFFFRRHHCRFCGRLLCENCTKHRIKKQRTCDSCQSAFDFSQNKNDWLAKAQEKEDAEEYKNASSNFVSPCLAFCGSVCQQSKNKLKILNMAYQKDRVANMKRRQLQLWFVFLACCIIVFHSLNSAVLPSRCSKSVVQLSDLTSTRSSYSMADSTCKSSFHPDLDIEKAIRFSSNNSITLPEETNGHVVNVTYSHRIENDALQTASLITGLVFYPLVLLYIYITQRSFTLQLFWLSEIILSLCLLVLLGLCLSYSILYGYLLAGTILMIQVTSAMEMAVSLISSFTTWALYLIIFTALVNAYPESYSLNDFLNHAMEKQTPIVVIAWFAGYVMDTRHREIYLKTESIKKQRLAIQTEQEKNKKLVSLPKIILDGLQEPPYKAPVLDAFGTVLYADIVSFTVFSGKIPAIDLVQILDDMFDMHDILASDLKVDKVKTLGDCYVACTGVLSLNASHAAAMVKFGLGLHWNMRKLNIKWDLAGKGLDGKGPDTDLRIRVGIASGPAIGGVVGGKKYIFDLWGDVVEQAELMESGGIPERVQVSHSTWLRSSKDPNLKFKCRPDAEQEVLKNDGANGPGKRFPTVYMFWSNCSWLEIILVLF